MFVSTDRSFQQGIIAGAVGQGQSQARSVPRDNSGVCHVLSGLLSAVVWEQRTLLGLMGALTEFHLLGWLVLVAQRVRLPALLQFLINPAGISLPKAERSGTE